MLILQSPLVDYYMLPASRILAHVRGTTTVGVLDVIQSTSTSATATQSYASPSSTQPVVLTALGDLLEQVVFLSPSTIVLLSSKISIQFKSPESKSKVRAPSPKHSPKLSRALSDFPSPSSTPDDDQRRVKHSPRSPKRKRDKEDKKSPREERKSPRDDEERRKSAKEGDEAKPAKRSKKSKDKSKSIDGTKKDKESKESKKDKEAKKDKKRQSPPSSLEIPLSSSSKPQQSPPASPNSRSSRKHKIAHSDSHLKFDSKSDTEESANSEDTTSETRSPSTGRHRRHIVSTPPAVSPLRLVEIETSNTDEDLSGSRSDTPTQSRNSRPARRDTSSPFGRQSSVHDIPSTLRRSQGSPSPGHMPVHSLDLLSVKNQWVQVLNIDTQAVSVFPATTLHPDICAEMGGVKRLHAGPEQSLLIETETGGLFYLASDSSVPQALRLPDDVSLRMCHVQTVSSTYVLFLKKSAAEFLLYSIEPPPFLAVLEKPESPLEMKRKQKKTSKLGLLEHLRPSWFSSSSVAALQATEENRPIPVLKPLVRAQSPEGATFLKFEVQNDLLIALTAVCIMTWEVGPLQRSSSVSSPAMIRIPLSLPIFATAVTRDRILTGDIDGTITVFERATGRKQYMINGGDESHPADEATPASSRESLDHPPFLSARGRSEGGHGSSGSINPGGRTRSGSGTSHDSTGRKLSLIDRMAFRIVQLFVFYDYYIFARFENGECSVWSLSANQHEPLQKIVKPGGSGKAGFTTLSSALGDDGTLVMHHTRGSSTTKVRILRCRPPATNFATTNPLGGEVKLPLAASLISGEMPAPVYRAASDYMDEITKLSSRIYRHYPWLGQIGVSEAISVLDVLQPTKPVVYVNSAFEKLTLYASEEVLGVNIRFLQGKFTLQDSQNKLKASLEIGDFCELEMLNYRKDGIAFFNHVTVLPLKSKRSTNKITHAIVIHRDVSASKLMIRKIPQWSEVEVAIWLEDNDFSQYGLTFIHKQVTGVSLLKADENFLMSIGVVRDDTAPLLKAIESLKFASAGSHSDHSISSQTASSGTSTSVLTSNASINTPTNSGHSTASNSGILMKNGTPTRGLFKTSSSSSMSLSMEIDSEVGEEFSTTLRRRAAAGTLIKLTCDGKVAIFLHKQPRMASDGAWSLLQNNIEDRFKDGPFEITCIDDLHGVMLVTEANWPTILANHLHHIIRLTLNRRSTMSGSGHLVSQAAMSMNSSSSGPSSSSPSSNPSPNPLSFREHSGSGSSAPSAASTFKLLSPKPLRIGELQVTYSSSPVYDVVDPSSSPGSPSSSTPMSTPPHSSRSALVRRSPSGTMVSPSSQSPRSVTAHRFEDMFNHRDGGSRSSSKDQLINQKRASTVTSLGTSVGSLTSFYSQTDEVDKGLIGHSLRRCIEKVSVYSIDAAKSLETVFRRAEEEYSWLPTARGALAIVENNPLHSFIFVNSEMERLTLHTRSSLLGRNYRLLVGKSTESSAQTLLEFSPSMISSYSTPGSPLMDIEVTLFAANGLPFVSSLLVYPISQKESAVPTHFVCLHRDVTGIKLQEISPIEWSAVEVATWVHQTEFSAYTKQCYDAGLTGSDLLAAAENPRAMEILAKLIGLSHTTQRVDFADLVQKLKTHASMSSTANFTSSSQSTHSSGSDVAAASPAGTQCSNSHEGGSSSPLPSPRLLAPPATGSPRALSAPIPTQQSPRGLVALKGALEQQQKKDERTVIKFYLGQQTALMPLHHTNRFNLDRLIRCAITAFGTSPEVELRVHSKSAALSKRTMQSLDGDLWRKLYQEMRGKVIRLDVIEFNSLGLPVDPISPVLFADNAAILNSSNSIPVYK
jgi:PAS domain S-box-containing protein